MRCTLARFVAVVGVVMVGLLAWPPGRVVAQAHLLGRAAPEIAGGPWLNSPPVTLSALMGRVVLVDFWTAG
ncbi:MAG TPA: hypothetical protein VN203_02145 [Candidatus Acidoferrum sp.]|nr:hypothetical protein [Candidatus Methylomirabilis sp.]HWU36415.1 hypothetical protein [Candidatus Acidoferrum sp.]